MRIIKIYAIFGCIFICLLMSLFRTYQKAEAYKIQATTLEATISDLDQEIRYTRIRLNDSIQLYQAEVKSLTYTQKNLKDKYDHLLAASKTNPKDVSNVTEVTTIIHSVDTVFALQDSAGVITASLVDPFINIDFEIFPDKNTIIEYEVRDSLTILNVQKRHSWLFGLIKWSEPKEIKVINHNPKATISSLQTIDVFIK